MGNSECKCIKTLGSQDKQQECIVLEKSKSFQSLKSIPSKEMSCPFRIPSEQLDEAFKDASFTRHTQDPSSRSPDGGHDDHISMSIISYRPEKDVLDNEFLSSRAILR